MTEQEAQKQVIDYLEALDFYTIKVMKSNRKGTHDIIGCSPNGRFFSIEMKEKGKKASDHQMEHFWQIKSRNGASCSYRYSPVKGVDLTQLELWIQSEGLI